MIQNQIPDSDQIDFMKEKKSIQKSFFMVAFMMKFTWALKFRNLSSPLSSFSCRIIVPTHFYVTRPLTNVGMELFIGFRVL